MTNEKRADTPAGDTQEPTADHPIVCELREAVDEMNAAETRLLDELPGADEEKARELAIAVRRTNDRFAAAFTRFEEAFPDA